MTLRFAQVGVLEEEAGGRFLNPNPPPVILLPFGEWPFGGSGLSETACLDQPELRSTVAPVEPPSVRV